MQISEYFLLSVDKIEETIVAYMLRSSALKRDRGKAIIQYSLRNKGKARVSYEDTLILRLYDVQS